MLRVFITHNQHSNVFAFLKRWAMSLESVKKAASCLLLVEVEFRHSAAHTIC